MIDHNDGAGAESGPLLKPPSGLTQFEIEAARALGVQRTAAMGQSSSSMVTVLSASNQPLTDAELKAIFDTHNRDASGGLNTKNLRLIIQEFLLLSPDEEFLDALLAEFDDNHDLAIQLDEFVRMVRKYESPPLAGSVAGFTSTVSFGSPTIGLLTIPSPKGPKVSALNLLASNAPCVAIGDVVVGLQGEPLEKSTSPSEFAEQVGALDRPIVVAFERPSALLPDVNVQQACAGCSIS